MKKRRKKRLGEVNCYCGAYKFVHRMMGGKCGGGAFVDKTFEDQLHGACKGCNFLVESEGVMVCEVLDGRDKTIYCPELQEFLRYESIRLYGVNADAKIENPKWRKKK